MRDFFEWWAGLPRWPKVIIALLAIAVSTVLWFLDRFWPWGWVAGVVLLIFSLPSAGEKKGYHDF